MPRHSWGPPLALLIVVWTLGLSWYQFETQRIEPDSVYTTWNDGALTVVGETPNGAAARAGISAGDRIFMRTYADAYRLVYTTFNGRPLTFDVEPRGGARREVTLRFNRPGGVAPSAWESVVTIVLFNSVTLLGALLVWRRPSVMTAAFALYVTFGPYDRADVMSLVAGAPNSVFGPLAIAIDVLLSTIPIAALLPFLARFPDPAKRSRAVIRAADVALGVICAATLIVAFVSRNDVVGTRSAQDVIAAITAGLIAICACLTLMYARGEDRVRTGWVLVGLALTAAAYAYNIANLWGESTLENLIMGVLMGAFPAAVTYAILRHRVLDLGFVVNRGLVYATLTALLLILVAFVDWAMSHTIAATRLTIAFEVLVSVGFGLALTWLHRRVETGIDAVLFRGRRRAQERIEVRIDALDFATNAEVVDAALVDDAARILDLSSAAVFRIAGGDYERTAAVGWSDGATKLDRNDLLVRALLAGEGTRVIDALDLADEDWPRGAARPDLAIPIVLRHRLIAVVLYGRPRDGTTLDAIERSMLERLARAAAGAYDAAEVARWSTLTTTAPTLATT